MTDLRNHRSRTLPPSDPDPAPLRIVSCRDLCAWNRTPAERRGEPVFACRGCGSQWVPSEDWTPRDSSGAVPPDVLTIRTAED